VNNGFTIAHDIASSQITTNEKTTDYFLHKTLTQSLSCRCTVTTLSLLSHQTNNTVKLYAYAHFSHLSDNKLI